MTPVLAATVERARQAARKSGELQLGPVGSVQSPFEPDERELIAAWHSSGEYERVAADIVTADPEVATQ